MIGFSVSLRNCVIDSAFTISGQPQCTFPRSFSYRFSCSFNRHIKKMLVDSHHRLVDGRRLLLMYQRGPCEFHLVPLALSFVGTALAAANYGSRVHVIFAKSAFSDS
jgi:hypothetical protein